MVVVKYFFQIYIPGVRELYTWHFETKSPCVPLNKGELKGDLKNNRRANSTSLPTIPTLSGSLVSVSFRRRQQTGLIIRQVPEPDFPTQPILKVIKQNFCPSHIFELSQHIAAENFCPESKVLAGVIPKEFFLAKTEVKKYITYTLNYGHPELDSGSSFSSDQKNLEYFFKSLKITGSKQRQALELIIKNHGSIDENPLRTHVSLTTIQSLIKKNIIVKKTGKIIPGLKLYDKSREQRTENREQRVSGREQRTENREQRVAGREQRRENREPRVEGRDQRVKNNLLSDNDSLLSENKFHPLTPDQQSALDQILQSDKPTLLWGITGSGKTEIYKQVIQHQLFLTEQNREQRIENREQRVAGREQRTENREQRVEGRDQRVKNNLLSDNDSLLSENTALFLLPEIALTPQLIEGFEHSFGSENIAVWHSKLSIQQKIQEWERITSGEARILIGTRSAVLLPIPNLNVIIMDEEHEWTYKNEFSPRFWTHDSVEEIIKFRSLRLSKGECYISKKGTTTSRTSVSVSPKLIFGSATPRIESFHRVNNGDWQRVKLTKRVKNTPLPNFSVIDLREEIKKNNPSPISERLDQKIRDALKRKKQVVLFLNKRGYSASTMCQFCSHTFECPHCDSKMKAHKRVTSNELSVKSKNLFTKLPTTNYQPLTKLMHKLVCHVCGHLEWFPDRCPECAAKNFEFKGWGTQQVEEELKQLYPQARILRADADTVTRKSDWHDIHQLFKHKQADILLGTQMISKGLDFEDVELVGIILADVGLNLPDFRSEERVFQLLTQVAGRAGRRETQGHIVLQTFQPDAKVFDYILRYDTEGFVEWQTRERKKHNFPPHCHLAKLTISHQDKTAAFKKAKEIETQLLKSREQRIENREQMVESREQRTENREQRIESKPTNGSLLSENNLLSKEINFEVSAAPAFFPRTHGQYHFHIYVKTTDQKILHQILTPFMHEKFVKIDISPSSIL